MSAPPSSAFFVQGVGAVSPAGWGAAALAAALHAGQPLAETTVPAGPDRTVRVRRVPAPAHRPAWLGHPRLRRTSPISQFAVSAALEALGSAAQPEHRHGRRLGVVCAVMTGSVVYSRRFFAEVLENPATASPMLFPETVFNAPAAHVAALLGADGPNYTIVADQTGFLAGLEIAADWLAAGAVDDCLVLASEELDWITAEAQGVFAPGTVMAEGAAALCLRREPSTVRLDAWSGTIPYRRGRRRVEAARRAQEALSDAGPSAEFFEASARPTRVVEAKAADPWNVGGSRRVSCQPVLGEGLAAAGGWPCVAAIHALSQGADSAATVGVLGSNLGAAAARFQRHVSGS